MKDRNERPHLSPTQIDMYCRCGEQYRRRYVEGEILPPAVAMVTGTAVHRGAEVNSAQKIRTREDLAVKDIVDVAANTFNEELLRSGVTLVGDEVAKGLNTVCGEGLDQAVKLAGLYAEQSAPDYQPAIVEEYVRLVLPGQYDILCRIDLIDELDRVIDFKTAKRKMQQADADASIQLTTYAAAGRKLLGGRAVSEVRLDVLVGTKKPQRQVIQSSRTRADFQALANRINVVAAGIAMGNFPPAAPGSWWCSKRFCGYHASCPYVNSTRKDTDQ